MAFSFLYWISNQTKTILNQKFIEIVTFPLWSTVIRTFSKKETWSSHNGWSGWTIIFQSIQWLLGGAGCEQARQAVVLLFQVSQAAAELQQYCMQNACKDALLVGVPAGSNPFREPRSCALLWRLVSNDTPWRYRRASQRIWATVLWISTILRGILKNSKRHNYPWRVTRLYLPCL